MTQQTPRRAAPDPEPNGPTWRKAVLAGIGTLAVVALAGTALALNNEDEAGETPAASSSRASLQACPDAARVLVDEVWLSALQQASRTWSASQGGDCSPIDLASSDSATVATRGLEGAAAWVPEDPTWRDAARDQALKQADPVSVGSSPLVLVQPKMAAEALGRPLSGPALRDLVAGTKTWGSYGHDGWGMFKLVSPDPVTSVVGARGQGALIQQVGAGARPDGNPFGTDPAQRAMASVPRRVVATVKPAQVSEELDSHPEDATGRDRPGPRAGLTTRALVWNKADSLNATAVGDGTGVALSVVSPAPNETVDGWSQWLRSADGAKALAAAGVDTPEHAPDAAQSKRLGLPDEPFTLAQNKLSTLEADRAILSGYARKYSMLMVLDNSGSMLERLPDGQTRINVVKNLMQGLWDKWPETMSTGLMTFNASNETNEPRIKTVVPLQSVGSKQWADNSDKYRKAVDTMQVEGGTPLYDAIATAYQYNMNHYQEGADNRIVILTDGRDGDAKQTVTYDTLLKVLPKQADATRPIKVLYVGLSDEADMATLNKIAKLTGQRAVKARTTEELSKALRTFVTQ